MTTPTLADLDAARLEPLLAGLDPAALASRLDGAAIDAVLRRFNSGLRRDLPGTLTLLDAWLDAIGPEGDACADPLAPAGVEFVAGAALGALLLAEGGAALRRPRGFSHALRRLRVFEASDDALRVHGDPAFGAALEAAFGAAFTRLCRTSPALRGRLACLRLAAAALGDDAPGAARWTRALFLAGLVAAGVAAPERRPRRALAATRT